MLQECTEGIMESGVMSGTSMFKIDLGQLLVVEGASAALAESPPSYI